MIPSFSRLAPLCLNPTLRVRAGAMLCSLLICGAHSAELAASVPEAAKEAWKVLSEIARTNCVRISVSSSTSIGTAPPIRDEEMELLVLRSGSHIRIDRIVRSKISMMNEKRSFAINERYGFVVRWDDTKRSWAAEDISMNSTGIVGKASREITAHSPVMCPLMFIRTVPVSDLLLSAESVTTTVQQDSGMQAVRFTRTLEANDKSPFRAGVILCDPKALWSIKEAEIELGSPRMKGKLSVHNEYTCTDNVPRVTYARWRSHVTVENKEYIQLHEARYADVMRTPESTDFTLSAFGLPEPFGVEWEKPTRWWLYIGGGTLGLIALAALGYRLFGRRAA